MRKKMSLQTLEEVKRRDGISPDPRRSEGKPTAPWNSPGSTVTNLDTQVPKINLKMKGKRKYLEASDQVLCVKIPEGDLGQNHSQLFWGLPSLHSESIMATLLVPVSSYSPEPCLVLFNGVCKAASGPVLSHGFPALPQPLTLVHPQPLPKVAPQPQTLTEEMPQAHMQSPWSSMALPSLPYGSALQIPQTRAVSDVINGKGHLQYHLVQNPQDSLWGLVPECQQYETALGLPVHSFPVGSQSSQTYVSVPGSGLFHFSSEHQNNLDPYGPNNLTSPSCFELCSRPGVPEVMNTQFKPTGVSSYNYKYAKSQCCVHWGNICADPGNGELSHSESYCMKVPMKPQLRKDAAKNLGQILGKCPLDNTQMISGCCILNGLKAIPETEGELAYHSRTDLENEQLTISKKNLDQRHMRSILRLHMSRKCWQITMGRIPIMVCCSWLTEDASLWRSPLGKIHCDTAIPEIPFLDRKTQKMLEAHLIRFRVSQQWGLPIKVIESIKFYILREAKTWPLSQSDLPLSLNSIPGLDLKSNFPSPLRGSSDLLHGDKIETTDSAPTSDYSLTLLHVDSEGERSLRQSVSSHTSDVSETVQTVEDDRPSNPDLSQNKAELQSRPRQEQPIKEDVTPSDSENERASSASHLVIAESRLSVEKNPKYTVTPNMLREMILKARELFVRSGSDSIIKSESSTKKDESLSSPLVATGQSSSRMSVPEDPTAPDFKKQLFKELRSKLEDQPQSQSEAWEDESSFVSDSFSGYSLPSSSNSVSSADVSVFWDTQSHMYSTGISVDPWQEPSVFKRILKNFIPAQKRLALPVSRKENGRSDPQELETPKAGKKSQPSKEKSGKREHPPDSYFRKKIGQFFQWLYSSKDSPRHKSEKDRALFMSCGPPEAHELMASLGKLLEDKMLYGQKSEFLEWSQTTMPAQPALKGQPSNLGAANGHHGEASNCSCPQTAITPGPSHMLSLGQRHRPVPFEYPPSAPESLSSVQAPLA
ncbi:spermatogenesis-associated protein 31D1-like [Mus caroli]|uniref:Spermatogenesis-associated protein 31D1-like n=1 Tax=Mus caroli TaxID=10089 RepID=A0A6P5QRH5_MUSCR|nr:spermatogenesis-associated protein 31D1-like [Mus caroli]XP_021036785.1 spermatogenesis-associated protein 31D1-like [Mus caroli]